jgi:putative membrane protein
VTHGRPGREYNAATVLAIAAILSALHLFALALGLPAVYLRARALRGPLDDAGLRRLFAADNVWGVAAALWLVTGLLRAFAGFEKGSAFYLGSATFWTKMALFLAIVLLEIRPMVTLIRWRRIRGRGARPDTSGARGLYVTTHVEMALAVLMVFVAAFMARGFGAR